MSTTIANVLIDITCDATEDIIVEVSNLLVKRWWNEFKSEHSLSLGNISLLEIKRDLSDWTYSQQIQYAVCAESSDEALVATLILGGVDFIDLSVVNLKGTKIRGLFCTDTMYNIVDLAGYLD